MSNLKNYLFTSESVSEGHPDKVSDRISDMVVDSYISRDPFERRSIARRSLRVGVISVMIAFYSRSESHLDQTSFHSSSYSIVFSRSRYSESSFARLFATYWIALR